MNLDGKFWGVGVCRVSLRLTFHAETLWISIYFDQITQKNEREKVFEMKI